MDQEETTTSAEATDDAPERGKVVATYEFTVTLREHPELSIDAWRARGAEKDPTPTVTRLEALIQRTLYDDLDYFANEGIRVSGKFTDR